MLWTKSSASLPCRPVQFTLGVTYYHLNRGAKDHVLKFGVLFRTRCGTSYLVGRSSGNVVGSLPITVVSKIEHQRHRDVSYFQIWKKKKREKKNPSHSLQGTQSLQSKIIGNLLNSPMWMVLRLKPVHIIQRFQNGFCITAAWCWWFQDGQS